MLQCVLAVALLLASSPAWAWEPPGGPMREQGAEKIYILTNDPHARLTGADAFTAAHDDAHHLVFRGGLTLSVPRRPSPDLSAEQELAVCRQALGTAWPGLAPGSQPLGSAPLTADGAVQVVACPRDTNLPWHYLAARLESGDWTAISRLAGGGLLTYEPADHTALVESPHYVGVRGAMGPDTFLVSGVFAELIDVMQQADEAVKAKLNGGKLGGPGTASLGRDGPGWCRVLVTTRLLEAGNPPVAPVGTTINFHFLADSYLSGIDRLQANFDPSREASFYPAPVAVVTTLRGPWMAYTAPVKPIEAAMPLFPGAEPDKAPDPATVLLSLGVSAPPIRIPQPGPGPAMTLATATDLFHAWIDAQPYINDNIKSTKVLPLGGPLVAKSFVPMTPDGSLVMISTEHTSFIGSSYFVAVRSAGSWQIVAQSLVPTPLLSWDSATGEGLAYADSPGAVDQAAAWSLRSKIEQFAIDWGTHIQPGLEGETGIAKWTGQDAGKPVKGEFHVDLTNVATNFWRIKAK